MIAPIPIRRRRRRPWRGSAALGLSMVAAIAAVAGLAWWDERREADAAMHELQREHAILASSVAGALRAHLASVERDAILVSRLDGREPSNRYDPVLVRPAVASRARATDRSRLVLTAPVEGDRVVDLGVRVTDLLDVDAVARDRDLTLAVSPPGDVDFRTADGRTFSSPALRGALDAGLATLRLGRGEAVQVGLPERTAVAGLAHADAGPFGTWGVVAVASAARERDRQTRATGRLFLSGLVASGLVLAFGGVALRKQRKELDLARRLAVAAVERQRDEQLLRAERVATMGTFALGIAHEVSTPLGVIVGRAEQLLARGKHDDRAARGAQAILEQADRIQQIVRRFLDMARGGRPSFDKNDPAAIVHRAAAALEHRFARAGVSLSTDAPTSLPLVHCDRDLLEHAIVNLLLNACEACAPGGHVEVAARLAAERVTFSVRDDGVGITAENAARATEPFFTTKARGSGTGLGLAIATEIAKMHRGDLTIAPDPDRGTKACIAIPVAAPDS